MVVKVEKEEGEEETVEERVLEEAEAEEEDSDFFLFFDADFFFGTHGVAEPELLLLFLFARL